MPSFWEKFVAGNLQVVPGGPIGDQIGELMYFARPDAGRKKNHGSHGMSVPQMVWRCNLPRFCAHFAICSLNMSVLVRIWMQLMISKNLKADFANFGCMMSFSLLAFDHSNV